MSRRLKRMRHKYTGKYQHEHHLKSTDNQIEDNYEANIANKLKFDREVELRRGFDIVNHDSLYNSRRATVRTKASSVLGL